MKNAGKKKKKSGNKEKNDNNSMRPCAWVSVPRAVATKPS